MRGRPASRPRSGASSRRSKRFRAATTRSTLILANLGSKTMTDELDELRRRSGPRNPDLDINQTRDSYEVFVRHVSGIEVHMPIEWVRLNQAGEVVFSASAVELLRDVRRMVRR